MKTDQELYNDVKNRLSYQPNVNANHIAFSIHDGVVTLGGAVATYNEKLITERVIKRVNGIRGIANEIKVECLPQHKRNDVDIVSAAVNALANDTTIPENIKVVVENGWLTLVGQVPWYFQKRNAELCVNNLYGIKGVSNQIQIKPSISPSEVKNKIIAQFKRNAVIDAQAIIVEVNGDVVVLKGKMRNWVELDEAMDAIWNIPGISSVDNQLTLV